MKNRENEREEGKKGIKREEGRECFKDKIKEKIFTEKKSEMKPYTPLFLLERRGRGEGREGRKVYLLLKDNK